MPPTRRPRSGDEPAVRVQEYSQMASVLDVLRLCGVSTSSSAAYLSQKWFAARGGSATKLRINGRGKLTPVADVLTLYMIAKDHCPAEAWEEGVRDAVSEALLSVHEESRRRPPPKQYKCGTFASLGELGLRRRPPSVPPSSSSSGPAPLGHSM